MEEPEKPDQTLTSANATPPLPVLGIQTRLTHSRATLRKMNALTAIATIAATYIPVHGLWLYFTKVRSAWILLFMLAASAYAWAHTMKLWRLRNEWRRIVSADEQGAA